MRLVFVDSSFYIAFVHARDADHASAVRLSIELETTVIRYVTTPAVILEVLAYFSRLGPRLRERAALLADRLLAGATVEVVALDDTLLRSHRPLPPASRQALQPHRLPRHGHLP